MQSSKQIGIGDAVAATGVQSDPQAETVHEAKDTHEATGCSLKECPAYGGGFVDCHTEKGCMTPIVAHMEYYGYRVVPSANNSHALCLDAPNTARVMVMRIIGGYWFLLRIGPMVKDKNEAIFECINMLNSESDVMKFYRIFDSLVVTVFYPGAYCNESFTDFLNAWQADMILLNVSFPEIENYLVVQ